MQMTRKESSSGAVTLRDERERAGETDTIWFESIVSKILSFWGKFIYFIFYRVIWAFKADCDSSKETKWYWPKLKLQ